jgi:hypothetical protein
MSRNKDDKKAQICSECILTINVNWKTVDLVQSLQLGGL